jgi:hypothetical protein
MDAFFAIELRLYSRDKVISPAEQTRLDKKGSIPPQILLQRSVFTLHTYDSKTGEYISQNVRRGDHTSGATGVRAISALVVYWKIYSQERFVPFRHPVYLPYLNNIRSPHENNRFDWVTKFFGKRVDEYNVGKPVSPHVSATEGKRWTKSEVSLGGIPHEFKDFFCCSRTHIEPLSPPAKAEGTATGRSVGSLHRVPPISIHHSRIYLDDGENPVTSPEMLFHIYQQLQKNDELQEDSVAVNDLRTYIQSLSPAIPDSHPDDVDSDLFRIASGGALGTSNRFYIERPFESSIQRLLDKGGATIAIRAPRQFGKTSLFVRMRTWGMLSSRVVIPLDFQSLDIPRVPSTAALFAWLYSGLDCEVRDLPGDLATNGKHVLTRVLRERLTKAPGGVILLIDEPDRLFRSDTLCSEFFSLLRFWHNQRAFYPASFGRLDLVFSYTSDPGLWIRDVNQSPFNVAYGVDVDTFTEANIADLIGRHGHQVTGNSPDVSAIRDWTGGHPHLTQLLVAASVRGSDLNSVVSEALRGEDHLGRCLRARFTPLYQDPSLCTALRSIFLGQGCEDHFAFESLWSMGLISGSSRRKCQLRCRLFADYFEQEFL